MPYEQEEAHDDQGFCFVALSNLEFWEEATFDYSCSFHYQGSQDQPFGFYHAFFDHYACQNCQHFHGMLAYEQEAMTQRDLMLYCGYFELEEQTQAVVHQEKKEAEIENGQHAVHDVGTGGEMGIEYEDCYLQSIDKWVVAGAGQELDHYNSSLRAFDYVQKVVDQQLENQEPEWMSEWLSRVGCCRSQYQQYQKCQYQMLKL